MYSRNGYTPSTGGELDYYADTQIGMYGLAINQFISAYNYYQEMTAQAFEKDGKWYIKQLVKSDFVPTAENGENVDYIASNITMSDIDISSYYYVGYKEVDKDSRQTINGNISLIGHSLGGHLAGILSRFTGLEANIFNAPGYHEASTDAIFSYLLSKGIFVTTINTSFHFSDGIVVDNLSYLEMLETFLGNNYHGQYVNQLINSNNIDVIANLFSDWENSNYIECLNQSPSKEEAHSIKSIVDTLYAYKVIKDIINDSDVFLKEKENATSQTAFENVYKAYCVANRVSIETLDYSDNIQIQGIITKIADWIKVSQENGISIKIDVYYKDETEDQALIGTVGDDILYGGDGNNLIKGGTGSDTYIFRKDDVGTLIVEDSSGTTDKIIFDGLTQFDGFLPSELKFVANGANLEIYTRKEDGTREDVAAVIIKNFFRTSVNDINEGFIEEFQFKNITITKSLGDNEHLYLSRIYTNIIEYDNYINGKFYSTNFNEKITINGNAEIYSGKKRNDLVIYNKTPNASIKIYLENPTDVVKLYNQGNYDIYCLPNNSNIINSIEAYAENITIHNFSNNTGFYTGFEVSAFDYAEIIGNDVIFKKRANSDPTFILKNAAKYFNFYGYDKIYMAPYSENPIYYWDGEVILANPEQPLIYDGPTRITYPFDETVLPESTDYNSPTNSTENLVISDPRSINKITLGEEYQADKISCSVVGTSLFIKSNANAENYIEIQYYKYLDSLDFVQLADGTNFDVSAYNYMSLQTENADILYGTTKNDVIYGDAGDDIILAKAGNDLISGGKGNDVLHGGVGNDTYFYNLGDGYDIISEEDGEADKIVFGEGISVEDLKFRDVDGILVITIKDDATQGIEILQWQDSSYKIEKLVFADGSEVALTEIGLTFHQKDEDVFINTTQYDDIVYAGNGDNNIYTLDGNDIVYGGNDSDFVSAGAGEDIVYGGEGNDEIYGGEGNDILYGESGDDYLDGGSGNDILIGGIGNDYLYDGDGDDTIYGGTGNDDLDGGIGDDVFIYNLGDGADTIFDNAGTDKIVFGEGISLKNLHFSTIDKNLTITINGDETQSILIYFHYYSTNNNKIETLEFADGSSIDISNATVDDLNMLALGYPIGSIVGTNAEDVLNGTTEDDILIGGKGNDSLYGDEGSDTYIYNLGDGLDYIYDANGSDDKIIFGEGISFDDLKFRSVGNNIIITVKGDETQGIEIYNWQYSNYKIEKLQFADGSEFALTETGLTFHQKDEDTTIYTTQYDDTIYAGNENNYISSGDGNDIIYTGSGNDYVDAGNGNDAIYGNVGNDSINGGDGDDIIAGGKGDDYLSGDMGNDTYIYNLGDGNDTIFDYGGDDKIIFGANISYDDLNFVKNYENLYVIIKSDQYIEISNYFNSEEYMIEKLVFDDGSEVDMSSINLNHPGLNLIGSQEDDLLSGTSNDDIFTGNQGNDIINAGYGSDTFIYNLGDGFDTINNNLGENDKIIFGEGINLDNLGFKKENDDLIIFINNDETQGIKILNSFYSDFYKIETLEFFDRTSYSLSSIVFYDDSEYGYIVRNIYGTSENDTLIGSKDIDNIYAGDGDDIIVGGKGNDLLRGDYGNDTYIYNLGDGFDSIFDEAGEMDKIVFGEGISFEDLSFVFEPNGQDLIIQIKSNETTQEIRVLGYFYSSALKIEKLEFADGSTVNLTELPFNQEYYLGETIYGNEQPNQLNGTNKNDTIYGGDGGDIIVANDGDDTLIGGADNDYLLGGNGSDTYVYNLGDGYDYIRDDNYDNNNYVDRIVFGEGIKIQDLYFQQEGAALIIKLGKDSNDGMKIENQFYNSGIEILEFSDGTSINISQYNSAEQLIQAMSGFGSTSSSNFTFGIQEMQIIENVITANSLKSTAA
ncbi:MAG: calcium-binding protein [Alphaproteobacteria bacterium]